MQKFIKIFFLSFLFISSANASNQDLLEITALNMQSNEKKGITTISGNVIIKRNKDILKADKVVIYTDKDKKPTKYIATGEIVDFLLYLDQKNSPEKREIKGKCKKLVYLVEKGEYQLYDNAIIKEKGKNNVIKGEEIILNNNSGYADVKGNKKRPVKLIFSLDKDKND